MEISIRRGVTWVGRRKKAADTIEVTDIGGLKDRLSRSNLSPEDIHTLSGILVAFLTLQDLVRKRGFALVKFLRRLFGAKTEYHEPKPDKPSEDLPGNDSNPKPSGGRRGRNGRDDYPGAKRHEIKHPTLKRNDSCPECKTGVLNEGEPAVNYTWQGSPPLVLNVYLLERFICNLCKTTFTAPSPVGSQERTVDDSLDEDKVGRCDHNAMANAVVAILRFWYGVAHYRLAKIQGSLGMALPVGTQYRMVLRVFSAAESIYDHLISEAALGALFFADDTAIKILDWLAGKGPPNKSNDKPKKKAQTSAVISRSREGRTIVIYLTNGEEAGALVTTILEKRDASQGPLIYMCDGLAANKPRSEISYIQVHCLDHARRQFYDLKALYPEPVNYVLSQLQIVYRIDAEAKDQGMTTEERLLHHQTHSRPVMDSLGRWLQSALASGNVEENDELGKAINYSLKRWTELNEFHHIAGVPLSNAECERAIKSIIRHRKNSLAYKTENGAHVGDVIQSLIATCEYAEVNIFDYLAWIQTKKSAVKADPAKHTPWAYTAQLG